MKFSKIVDIFESLEKITSGNKIRIILADFLKKCPKSELKIATYLLSGRISSEYKGVITGMSNKLVLRSIAIASKKDISKATKIFKKTGDAGLTAQKLVGKRRETLSLKQVFQTLHKISSASGSKSQDVKIKTLANLLRVASRSEAKYISRLVVGTMRLGAGDRALLDALSIAFTGSKDARKALDKAYQVNPDLGDIAEKIAKKKIKAVVSFRRPIKSMLAQRSKSMQDIFNKIPGEMSVEEKYDGERMQIHIQGKNVTIFSRRLENISHQYPDVIDCIQKNIKCKSAILDGECCAVKGNKLLHFQVLMQRRRKYDVEKYIKKIPVCLFLFDILYLNGKSYLQKSYPERYKALKSTIKQQTSCVKLANRIVTKNPKKIQEFFKKMLKKGAEGIMIKSLAKDSVYKAGKRGWLWIKWKKEYAKGMVDTFDLVVIGAFRGHGTRGGTYGSLLCAVYNKKTRKYETFTKVGSGFTKKQLKELPKKLRKYELKQKHNKINAKKQLKPDVWFKPVIVVEVLGAEITKSPLHTANGLALRFPRFLRFRPDKSATQATTTKEVLQFYKKK
jgi:DNA ligase-1